MPPLNHPEIFACLAMVVGLYGVVYFEVARVPERGWVLAVVGLAGKILGPIGLAVAIARGLWPPSAVVLCLTNDLIWWIPFGLYLKDSWPVFRADLRRERSIGRVPGGAGVPTSARPDRGSGSAPADRP